MAGNIQRAKMHHHAKSVKQLLRSRFFIFQDGGWEAVWISKFPKS